MAQVIDERVVEMRFDNKQFEKGTKETIDSLERLKKSLDMSKSVESLKQIDKAASDIKLDGIAAGVEALQDRFSTLGIVGMRVITNITDSLMGLATKGIRFVTDSIVSGGIKRAMNLENAHFQLQALLKDEKLVASVMQSANDSVTGTAYSYDTAAKAASMFAASNVQAGEQMDAALNAIANSASAVNADYESMANLMTKIAGQGRIMGQELNQFASHGMNAAAALATYWREVKGEVNTTEADIRKLISDKDSNVYFQDVVDALNYVYDGAAKRANETFTGALSNVKAALGRIGAEFISPLVVQNGALVNIFNTLRLRINEVKDALTKEFGDVIPLSKQFTNAVINAVTALNKMIESADLKQPLRIFYNSLAILKNILKAIYSVIQPISKAFKEVFLSFDKKEFADFTDIVAEFSKKLEITEKATENLHDAFKGVFDVIKQLAMGVLGLIHLFVPAIKPANSLLDSLIGIAGEAGRALSRFVEWINSSERITKVFDKISRRVEKTKVLFSDIAEAFKKFIDSVKNLDSTKKTIENIQTKFSSLGDTIVNKIDSVITKIKEFRFGVKESVPKEAEQSFIRFSNIFEKLSFEMKSLDWSNPVSWISNVTTSIRGLVQAVSNNEGVSSVADNAKEFSNEMTKAFTFDRLVSNIRTCKEAVDGFIGWIKDKVVPFLTSITFGDILAGATIFGTLYSFITIAKSIDRLTKKITGVADVFGTIRDAIASYQKDLDASAILKIALAISALSASLVLLSFTDPKRLLAAAAAMSLTATVFFGGLTAWNVAMNKSAELPDVLDTFAKGLSRGINNLTEAVKNIAFGAMMQSLSLALITSVGAIVAVGYVYDKHSEWIEKGAYYVKQIVLALLGVIAAVSLMDKIFSTGSKTFLKLGVNVALVSASLVLAVNALKKLFKIKLPEDASKKMEIFNKLFGDVAILLTAIAASSFISGDKSFNSSKALLTSIVSIYLLVGSIKKLFKLDIPYDYKTKMNILSDIFKSLCALLIIIGISSKVAGGALKAGGTLIAMCVVIGTITTSLLVLSTVSWDKMKNGATALGIVLGTLGVALLGTSKMTGTGAGATVFNMAILIGAIVVALNILQFGDFKELLKSALLLDSVLIVLGGCFVAISKIRHLKTELTVLSMVAAMGAIASSLYILAKKNWTELIGGVVSLSTCLIVLTKCLKNMSGTYGLKWQKAIGIISTTVAMLAPIVLTLAIITAIAKEQGSWTVILATCAGISGVLFTLSKVLKEISAAKGLTNSEKNLEVLSVSIGLFVPIVVGLATLTRLAGGGWQMMISSAVSMGTLALALAKCFEIVNGVEINEDLNTNSSLLLTGLQLFTPIVLALGILSKIVNPQAKNLISCAVSMSTLLLALGVTMKILSGIEQVEPAVVLATLGVFVNLIGIAAALKIIEGYDPQALIPSAVALGGLLLALSVVVAILTGIGALGPVAAATGVVTLAAVMLLTVGFVALIVYAVEEAMKYLGIIADKNEKYVEILTKGKDVLVMIAQTIGEFAGAIIEGLGNGIGEALVNMGQSLTDFYNNSKPFFDGIESIGSETVLQSVGNLAACIFILTGAELIETLKNIFTAGGVLGYFSDLGTHLQKSYDNLAPFLETVKSITESDIQNVGRFEDLIVSVANIGSEQTLFNLRKVLTLGDFGGSLFFARDMKNFGNGLVAFSEAIDGKIAGTAVDSAITAGNMLVGLAKEIPLTKITVFGDWEIFKNDNNMTDFGRSLKYFGKYLSEFSSYITGKVSGYNAVDTTAVTAASNAAQALAAVANNLPDEHGFTALERFFKGDNRIETFADQLPDLGKGLCGFAQALSGENGDFSFSASEVEAAGNAAQALAKLASDIPSDGGVIGWIFGDKDLEKFASGIERFGSSIVTYAGYVIGMDFVKLNRTTESLTNLLTFLSETNNLDTQGTYHFQTAIENISQTTIDELEQQFKDGQAVEKITNAILSLIDAVSEQITNSEADVSMSGSDLGNAFTKGIQGVADREAGDVAGGVGGKLVSSILTRTGEKHRLDAAKNRGTTLSQNFSEGWVTKKALGDAGLHVATLIKKISDKLEGEGSNFNKIGIETAKRYSSGLKELEALMDVNISGYAIVWALEKILKEGVNFIELGKYVVSQFVNGIVSSESVQAIQNACNTINNQIASTFSNEAIAEQFTTVGENIVEGLDQGMKEKQAETAKATAELAGTLLSSLKNSLGVHSPSWMTELIGKFTAEGLIKGCLDKAKELFTTGSDMGNTLFEGLSGKISEVLKSEKFSNLLNKISDLTGIDLNFFSELKGPAGDFISDLVEAVKKYMGDGDDIGTALVKGIEEGVTGKIDEIMENIQEEIDENELSVNMNFDTSSFESQISSAIKDMEGEIASADIDTSEIEDNYEDTIQRYISDINKLYNDSLITDPTIYPTVDLTEVEKATQQINDMFNEAVQSTTVNANSVSQAIKDSTVSVNGSAQDVNSDIQNEEESNKTGNTYTFNQYNTSPKALSRIEIYRQTNNQFARFREAVDNS